MKITEEERPFWDRVMIEATLKLIDVLANPEKGITFEEVINPAAALADAAVEQRARIS